MLPRFLLADNSIEQPEKLYVVHTQSPRFILEGDCEEFTENQKMHWIDKNNLTDEQVNSLVLLANEFIDAELDNEEQLYDDMLDDDE